MLRFDSCFSSLGSEGRSILKEDTSFHKAFGSVKVFYAESFIPRQGEGGLLWHMGEGHFRQARGIEDSKFSSTSTQLPHPASLVFTIRALTLTEETWQGSLSISFAS